MSHDAVLSTSFALPPPIVCTVYPSFVVLAWSAPTAHRATPPVAWSYTVEFNCTTLLEQQPPVRHTTTRRWLTLPLLYPNDACHVRLLARGTCADGVSVLATSKLTFFAHPTVRSPWLESNAWGGWCVADALWCAMHGTTLTAEAFDTVAPTHRHIEHCAVRRFTDGFRGCVTRVRYRVPPAPLRHTTVYYVAAVERTARSGRVGAHDEDVLSLLLETDVGVVFCGVGEHGAVAVAWAVQCVTTALAVMDVAVVRDGVWCVTFGPARLRVCDAAASPPWCAGVDWSGNFLRYSAVATPGVCELGVCMDGTADVLQRQLLLHHHSACAEQDAVSLGVCGGPCGNTTAPFSRPPWLATLSVESAAERTECLDTHPHASVLYANLTQSSTLTPRLTHVTATVHEGWGVRVVVKGAQLHHTPHVCLLALDTHTPVPLTTHSVCASELCAVGSLRAALVAHVRAAVSGSVLRLQCLVQTEMGVVVWGKTVHVRARSDTLALLRHAASTPTQLLTAALMLQPVLALGPHRATGEVGPYTTWSAPTTDLLRGLAEVVEKVEGSTSESSWDVLAHVSRLLTRDAVAPPAVKKTCGPASELERLLRDLAAAPTPAVLHTRLLRWRDRVLRVLWWLRDECYPRHLRWLLSVLPADTDDDDDDDDDDDTLALVEREMLLYERVMHCLGDSVTSHDIVVPPLSHASLVDRLGALFLYPTTPAPPGSTQTQIESLWTVCASVLGLRDAVAGAPVVVVTGCAGAGRTTVGRACEEVLHGLHARYPHARVSRVQLVTPRAAYLDRVRDLITIGVPVTVVLVGEVGDVKEDGALYQLWRDYLSGARVGVVVSKVDEHVRECDNGSAMAWAAALCDTVCRTVHDAHCPTPAQPWSVLAVALAPSLDGLASALRCDAVRAQELALALSRHSRHALYALLRRALVGEDTNGQTASEVSLPPQSSTE